MIGQIVGNIVIGGVTKVVLKGAKYVAKKTDTELDDTVVDFLDNPAKCIFKKEENKQTEE